MISACLSSLASRRLRSMGRSEADRLPIFHPMKRRLNGIWLAKQGTTRSLSHRLQARDVGLGTGFPNLNLAKTPSPPRATTQNLTSHRRKCGDPFAGRGDRVGYSFFFRAPSFSWINVRI